MKFHVTLNDDDYLAFNVCNYMNNPANKQVLLKELLKMAGWSVLLVLMVFIFTEPGSSAWIILLGVLLAFNGALIYYVIPRTGRVRKFMENYMEKLKEQGKLPYDAEVTVEFSDEEIRETSASGMQHRKYSEIAKMLRDEERIYITLDAVRAVILPLRCLDGKENELLEFLEGKLRQHGVQTDARS